MVKPIIRDVGMILVGVGITVIGYLGLTGTLTYSPILGAGLIIPAYSLGKRVSTHQGEHVKAR